MPGEGPLGASRPNGSRAAKTGARAQAEREGLCVEFVQSDMGDFLCPSAFDGAVNAFTSFSYFEDPADGHRVASNLFQSLTRGGALLIDTQGKEVIAHTFRERDWHEEEDGTLMLEERKMQPGWDSIDVRWTLLKGSDQKDVALGHRLHSANELLRWLEGAGFAQVDVYTDLEGAPYDQNARRLVAVARRAKT